MVQQPTWCRHENIGALTQAAYLGLPVAAADDGCGEDAAGPAEPIYGRLNLKGQFPGQCQINPRGGPFGPSANRAIIGTPNAEVLPVPVCAQPRTSRPCSAGGMTRA